MTLNDQRKNTEKHSQAVRTEGSWQEWVSKLHSQVTRSGSTLKAWRIEVRMQKLQTQGVQSTHKHKDHEELDSQIAVQAKKPRKTHIVYSLHTFDHIWIHLTWSVLSDIWELTPSVRNAVKASQANPEKVPLPLASPEAPAVSISSSKMPLLKLWWKDVKRCEVIWHDVQNVSDIHWIPLVIHWYQWHEVVITLAASCSWRAVPITKAYWSSHPPQCQDPGHEDTSSTYLDHLASGSNILEPAPTSSQKLRKRFCNKEQIHRRTHKLKLGITPACHKLRDFAWLCDSYCCRQAQVVQVTQRDLTPFRRPQIQY